MCATFLVKPKIRSFNSTPELIEMGGGKKATKKDSYNQQVQPSKLEDRKGKRNKFKGSKKNYNSEEELRFAANLAAVGLEIKHMEGDGNCMFRSLSDQLKDDASKHFLFREKIMSYIEENREHFSLFMEDDEPFDDYLARMKTSGEWGGHQELYAASQCLEASIVVHQQEDDRPRYVLMCPNTDRFINISYHGECHYNSVRPIQTGTQTAAIMQFQHQDGSSARDRVAQSVAWATDKDIAVALELTHNNVDEAIDFLCINMSNMGIFHKTDSDNINSSDQIIVETVDSKEPERKRYAKKKASKPSELSKASASIDHDAVTTATSNKKSLSKKVILECIVTCNITEMYSSIVLLLFSRNYDNSSD